MILTKIGTSNLGNRVFKLILSILLSSAPVLAADVDWGTTKTKYIKETITIAMKKSSEGEAIHELNSHKHYNYISCIIRDGAQWETYTIGNREIRKGPDFIVNAQEQKCWDILRQNYGSMQLNRTASKRRSDLTDIFGNKELLVFEMPIGDFVVLANQNNMIHDFIAGL